MSSADAATRLVVYSRDGCGLCEEMIAGLRERLGGRGLAFEVRDVDRDPATRARFGMKIPVLTLDGRLVCHGRLDAARLERLLGAARG